MCNGIVREYCRQYDRVGIFCFPKNYPSVSFMYRDLPNLTIHVVRSYGEKYRRRVLALLPFWKAQYDTVRVIGTYDQESEVLFERQVYGMAGVPLAKKWDSFYVPRDTTREETLFAKIAPSGPYAFVHDDARYPINPARLPTHLPLVRPNSGLTDTIFDYGATVERAAEVHVIDSSFMFLVDCLPYTNPTQKLFVHRYARPNTPCQMPILKKPWNILL
jgi:hypothetical protein